MTESEGEDGRLMAFEFVIEGRGAGKTLIRLVHSGFLPDTDWERDPGAVVEWLMVATVVVALVSFAVWLLAFADLSRMVPQELQPG